MPTVRRIAICLWGALLACVAAEARADSLSLESAVARALAQNYGLAAMHHSVEAAAWELKQARGQLLPSLALDSRYTRLDEETVGRANAFGTEMTFFYPDTASLSGFASQTIEIPQTVFQNGYETTLSAQWPVLNPSIWNSVALASSGRDFAQDQMRTTRSDVVHQTLRGFINLLKIDSLIRIQEQLLGQARESRAQAERLLAVGRYAEADVHRWRVEEAQQEQTLVQLSSARRVAALALENMLGDPPTGSLLPDALLPANLEREIRRFRHMTPEAWEIFSSAPLSEVVRGNPQLGLLERTVRLSELQHRQSKCAFLPSVTLSGGYGWQANETLALDGDQAWSISAILSVPIFTGLSNWSTHHATRHKLLATHNDMQAAQRGILLSAETARTAIRSQVEQLRLAEVSLASARRNFEIRENSFRLGRLSNLEWIDALLALRSAEQTGAAAHYDLVLAVADYYRAAGRILALVEE